MKNVLLLVHDDAGQEARLQAALDLTRALNGHLYCLDVSVMPKVMDCPYEYVGVAMLLEDERTREAKNKQALERRLANEDVAWSWTDVTGDFVPALRNAAALADLIVVNRKLSSIGYPDTRRAASDLIVKAGRPVIAVPEDARTFDAFGRAIIAWNGSHTSTAAMIAAVPLLKLAGTVVLLQIENGSIETPVEEAASYLARYDLHARIEKAETSGRKISETILDAIKTHRASYLVMGGYGHSRTAEAIFGGVTRAILTDCPVPVLLAH